MKKIPFLLLDGRMGSQDAITVQGRKLSTCRAVLFLGAE